MLNVAAASHNSISRRSGKAVDPEELLRQRAEEQDWSHKLSADLPIVRLLTCLGLLLISLSKQVSKVD